MRKSLLPLLAGVALIAGVNASSAAVRLSDHQMDGVTAGAFATALSFTGSSAVSTAGLATFAATDSDTTTFVNSNVSVSRSVSASVSASK